jgi:hypothetical protein
MKMEAVQSSEMPLPVYQIIWHHISKDHNVGIHHMRTVNVTCRYAGFSSLRNLYCLILSFCMFIPDQKNCRKSVVCTYI